MSAEWKAVFTERELKEITFAQVYTEHYNHGTDGHNAKVIIAKLVAILEANHIENVPPMQFASSVKS